MYDDAVFEHEINRYIFWISVYWIGDRCHQILVRIFLLIVLVLLIALSKVQTNKKVDDTEKTTLLNINLVRLF